MARIVRRDGGICHLCGQPGATSADHLVPRSQGGPDTDANLAAAHIHCNKRRGVRSVDTVRAEIAAETQTNAGWQW